MNTNLLKLKKGPINNQTAQRLSSSNPAAVGSAKTGTGLIQNSIAAKAADNIAKGYNAAKESAPGNQTFGNAGSHNGIGRVNVPGYIAKNTPQNSGMVNSVAGNIGKINSMLGNPGNIKPDKNNIPDNGLINNSGQYVSDSTGSVRAAGSPGVVRVRDYVAAYPNLKLSYDKSLNKVYLNGREVPISHISNDGRSYAKKSDLDALVNEINYGSPYSKESILKNIVNSEQDIYDSVDKLRNREKFSYDYRRDPVYEVYSDYYDRLRDNAVREAISGAVARTGGLMNSNAASVAYQTAAEYDKKKADIIPTLEAQAYQRYASENQLDNEAATAIGNMVNSYMGNIASVYGQKDGSDLQKYNIDSTIAQNESEFARENDRLWAQLTAADNQWYAEFLESQRQFAQSLGYNYDQLSLEEQKALFDMALADKKLAARYSSLANGNPSSTPQTLIPLN